MFKKKIAISSFLLIASTSAHAVSLHNKDSRSYDIRIEGSSTVSTSIGSGTVKGNVCSGSCTISVSGVGTIDARGSDRVVIKNGALSK